MGNNPANLLAVDSRTGIITLRNKITWDQYNMLNGKYEGTILSIAGKRLIDQFITFPLDGVMYNSEIKI